MSLSDQERAEHQRKCLLTALAEVGDEHCYERVYFTPGEDFPAAPRSIWRDLSDHGFLEPSPHAHGAFRLTGWGWTKPLTVAGQLESPELKVKAGRLSAALKATVDGRHEDGFAEIETIVAAIPHATLCASCLTPLADRPRADRT